MLFVRLDILWLCGFGLGLGFGVGFGIGLETNIVEGSDRPVTDALQSDCGDENSNISQ
jgi:hypothetical protein